MSMSISDRAISKIKNANYCCIIVGISKSEAIKGEHYKYQEQFLCYKVIRTSTLIKHWKIIN